MLEWRADDFTTMSSSGRFPLSDGDGLPGGADISRSAGVYPRLYRLARVSGGQVGAAFLVFPIRQNVAQRLFQRNLRLPAGGGADPGVVAAHLALVRRPVAGRIMGDFQIDAADLGQLADDVANLRVLTCADIVGAAVVSNRR